jgi:hypothetical protein
MPEFPPVIRAVFCPVLTVLAALVIRKPLLIFCSLIKSV